MDTTYAHTRAYLKLGDAVGAYHKVLGVSFASTSHFDQKLSEFTRRNPSKGFDLIQKAAKSSGESVAKFTHNLPRTTAQLQLTARGSRQGSAALNSLFRDSIKAAAGLKRVACRRACSARASSRCPAPCRPR